MHALPVHTEVEHSRFTERLGPGTCPETAPCAGRESSQGEVAVSSHLVESLVTY